MTRHLATIIGPGRTPDAAALVAEIDRLAARAELHCTALAPERTDTSRWRKDGRPVTEHVTDQRFTTPSILRQEQDLQTWATSAAGTVAPTADPQGAAARAIAGQDPLVVVVGPAGTGKTHTTALAVAAMRARGRPVVGLAPSGKAADVLGAEAHCPTDTVAGFLTRHRSARSPWPEGTTVILDEVGMTATADLARLVAIVRTNRWRLVTVGDPAQLPAMARGGVFAHWCETVPHHTLDTLRRFTQPWEAAASLGLRAGRSESVAAYAEHGRLHSAHPVLVASQVVRAHREHVAAGRSVAITTNTAETARAINREIQRLLHPRASNGTDLHDATTVHVGDKIATRRNEPTRRTDHGDQVRNRQTWTVTAVHADGGITARHGERGSVDLPPDYVARHVELGWAVTGYGNQGDTVDVGLAVLEAGTNRNHAYVALTRGRTSNTAWIPDPTGTTDPADQLAAMIAHSADRDSALAVHALLHRAAGLPVPQLPGADQGRHAPTVADLPTSTAPGEASTDQKVRAVQERLDRLQRQSPGRSLGR